MKHLGKIVLAILLFGMGMLNAFASLKVPILTYHNFNLESSDSMTLSTEKFEAQLKWLKENGYTVIALKDLLYYFEDRSIVLPSKPVVITADDGLASVYTYMWPIIRKHNIPVTLFVFPSSISQSKNSMTWEQLREMQRTGLVDIQDHTYQHPNFKKEAQRLTPEQYQKFVELQLTKSKEILEQKLGTKIILLAWPYGIYDEYLTKAAEKAGFTMAFSIDQRPASRKEKWMAQPRFMVLSDSSVQEIVSKP